MNIFRAGVVKVTIAAVFIIFLSGCASDPTLHSNYDKSADFSVYKTFSFISEPGTSRAGYATSITEDFKSAIRHEMEARGYTHVESDADLLVNFNTRIRHESNVSTLSSPEIGPGYYGYRNGLYTTGSLYGNQVFIDNYRMGTVNIDVVDAQRKQLVWEGVAEASLTERMLQDPGAAISLVVGELFSKYPAIAGTAATGGAGGK